MAPKGRKALLQTERPRREDNMLGNYDKDFIDDMLRAEDDICRKPELRHIEEALQTVLHSPETGHFGNPGRLGPGAQLSEQPSAMAESVMEMPWAPSAGSAASSSSDTDRRIMSAAASIGGTAGLLFGGPLSGVALGTAAMYATSRDNGAGAAARKAGALYLQVSDWAVDRGLQGMRAAGSAADEGCRRLLEKGAGPYLESACQKAPASLRPKLRALAAGAGQAARSSTSRPAPRPEDVALLRERIPPDRVPVMCERSHHSSLPEMAKKKFAVPGSMLCGEFKYIVHKYVMQAMGTERPRAEQTIYIFVDGVMPKTSEKMADLYERLSGEDGFLHVRYCAENTLGIAVMLSGLHRE